MLWQVKYLFVTAADLNDQDVDVPAQSAEPRGDKYGMVSLKTDEDQEPEPNPITHGSRSIHDNLWISGSLQVPQTI